MLLAALVLIGCAPGPELTVVERPVPFGPDRVAAMRDYVERHYGSAMLRGDDGIALLPTMIVVHGTSDPDLETAYATFASQALPASRRHLAAAGTVNVAVHYLVDRDGTVYRLLPEDRMGRHCVGLNHRALAIENVGDGPDHPLTDAQLEANAQLVRDIAGRHAITHLVGHHEALWLEGGPLFHELDDGYRPFALDPGEAFMRRLRAEVADLGLQDVEPPF